MRLVLVQPVLHATPDADNVATIRTLVRGSGTTLAADDVVLLPEHVTPSTSDVRYEADVAALARDLGCHVVGGSQHQARTGGAVNVGVVCDATGAVVGRYEKLRPYAGERQLVRPGTCLGEIVIAGRNVLVLICADFWFADLIHTASRLPDVVLVPALSVTRKSGPAYSRALWRHLAVARAYEYGLYVGISDWAHASVLPQLSASSVGGFADPTTTDPDGLFQPIDGSGIAIHDLDFDRLEAFREDRRQRGFLWKPR